MAENSKQHQWRFTIFIVITLLTAMTIVWRYLDIMVLSPSPQKGRQAAVPVVERGPILDRNGRILAIQNEMDSVEAWMPYVKNPQETAQLLAEVLNLDPVSLLERMTSRAGSLWIKRKITPTESEGVQNLLATGRLPGIYIRKEYGRSYPEQNLASHLIGYAGTDNIGLEGIEYTLDEVLSPRERLNPDQKLFGNQVFLTIDVNIQFFTEQLAREAFETHNADSVTMLVMDAQNADILAYTSIPDFDPNDFQTSQASARKNRPIVAAFEPGSVFKVFSLASLLEAQTISANDTFYCDGSYENDSFPESIGCLGHHGWVTPYDIIKFSCNAGAAYASDTAERQEFYDHLRDFGFGATTQIPLPGESNGLLRPPVQWSARSKPTLAIGQEVLVSAVQIATAATVFTNQGVLLKPNVVDKIVSPNGTIIESYAREPVRRVVSPEVAEEILQMMETATEQGGTAWRLATPGIRISAKTGTAQMADPVRGGYSKDSFGASALAIFPTDDPQYILYIIIESPRSYSYYGGTIASPVIKKLIDELIVYSQMPRQEETVVTHPGTVYLPEKEEISLENGLPDFTGFSKRELMPLFSQTDLIIHLSGDGWVKSQSPAPGTPMTSGMVITLELE
jgi:cell division protein FtsI (penicillin-binding protein 3)